MPNPLRLLLPALIPSWNFFQAVAASPRVEYALSAGPDGGGAWRVFRPRPGRVSVLAMVGRLFWNARWNEGLFLVSCAERLMDEPTAHSVDEIFRRIAADLDGEAGEAWLSFRLVFVSEEAGVIERETAFVAEPRRRADIPVR
jgi:hypothetical protein